MKLAKFMASAAGRWLRIIVGLILILLGLFTIHGTAGIIVAIIGLVVLLAGVFNFCLIAPILGCPLKGSDLKE